MGLLYPFRNWMGNDIPFGVGYCTLLFDGFFHNLYFGDRPIVPRQFIETLITNATSGNKLMNIFKYEFFEILQKWGKGY